MEQTTSQKRKAIRTHYKPNKRSRHNKQNRMPIKSQMELYHQIRRQLIALHQKAAPVVRGGTTGPNGETIKGNINKKGEKIYHMPGSASYNRTIPEAWFSTPEEAEAAGYRAAKR